MESWLKRWLKQARVVKAREPNAEVLQQLAEYFQGRRTQFTLRLHWEGTEFQKLVWQELLKIPYGETRSYCDIAVGIGNPQACRAVGLANNKNPLAIVVPCHRVVGKNGSLTGYAGGLHLKEALLALEQKPRLSKNIINHKGGE